MFLTENEDDYFHKSESQQIRLTKYYFYQMNRLRQMYHVKNVSGIIIDFSIMPELSIRAIHYGL